MDARELLKKLSSHPAVACDMALQVQLGLPYLERKNNRLCISFMPHVESLDGENILFFAPQYHITWVYPFEHVVYFENLSYSRSLDTSDPVHTESLTKYANHGRYILNGLFEECTRVLSFYEKNGMVSDVTIQKYQKSYFDAVQALGLTSVYGGGSV